MTEVLHGPSVPREKIIRSGPLKLIAVTALSASSVLSGVRAQAQEPVINQQQEIRLNIWERIWECMKGCTERCTSWCGNQIDTHTISKKLREAEALRCASIYKYPGVHQDTDLEKILDAELEDGTIARFHIGEGNGPLYTFIPGNTERVDEPHRSALIRAYQKVCENGDHAVVMYAGGHCARPSGDADEQADVMYLHFLNILEALAKLEKNSSFIFVGYSWGGGMIFRGFEPKGEDGNTCDISERTNGGPTVLVVCIDPVHHGTRNLGFPIHNRPPGDFDYYHIIHESGWRQWLNPFNIDGADIENPSPGTKVIQKEDVDHEGVDEAVLPSLLKILKESEEAHLQTQKQ